MADDDRALMDRLAALEAEVKADADAQQARKAAALAKVRDERAAQAAERRAAAGTRDQPRVERAPRKRLDAIEDLGGAIELAGKASRVKQELARKPGKGEKSWIISGVASLALGPAGWLYAGSWREAAPATVGWFLLLGLVSKVLPTLLIAPLMAVVLPLSAIAGVVYALSYNRSGKRERLFDKDKDKAPPKQLR